MTYSQGTRVKAHALSLIQTTRVSSQLVMIHSYVILLRNHMRIFFLNFRCYCRHECQWNSGDHNHWTDGNCCRSDYLCEMCEKAGGKEKGPYSGARCHIHNNCVNVHRSKEMSTGVRRRSGGSWESIELFKRD